MTLRRIIILIALLCCAVPPALAQETTITGYLDDAVTSKSYPITLAESDVVLITAEKTDGDLDTVLSLFNPDGVLVAANDDRNAENYNSALIYTTRTAGEYTIEVSRYEHGWSSGSFEMRITIGGNEIFAEYAELTRIELSGETRTFDTENFRIHYTLEGEDAVTTDYLKAVAAAFEEMLRIQVEELGWPPPPPDGGLGGDDRYDVYLIDLIGSGQEALGYTSPQMIIGDNPHTDVVETHAATSQIAIDNDFEDADSDNPLGLMRATVAHELHHAIQFGYDSADAHNWIYEATASWIETVAAGEDQDATGYVEYAFNYPELCFGTTSDPGRGDLQYGEWTFIQALTDDYGSTAIQELWRNLGNYDGFEALTRTLEAFDTTIPQALAAYRIRNLARDYELAPLFNATVWLEETIDEPGRWTYRGEGIQELGANYFDVTLPDGLYYAGLMNDKGALELWAVGIAGEQVDAIPLGRGGMFDNTGYDNVYLMVFNPNYDEDVDDCTYYDYEIDVRAGKGEAAKPERSWNGRNFAPLR